ncbi:MAG: hypothetical protein WKF46_08110 [Candidatus Limnocylindrales bacterium]
MREPRRWAASAEEELLSAELLRHVSAPGGISCRECSLLDISEVNQRVLLHRARRPEAR